MKRHIKSSGKLSLGREVERNGYRAIWELGHRDWSVGIGKSLATCHVTCQDRRPRE